jgi:hypothetical protein
MSAICSTGVPSSQLVGSGLQNLLNTSDLILARGGIRQVW